MIINTRSLIFFRLGQNTKKWPSENAEYVKQFRKDNRARTLENERALRKKRPYRNRIKIAARRARKANVPSTLTEKEEDRVVSLPVIELGRRANLAESARECKGTSNGRAKLTEENVLEIIRNKTLPTRLLAKNLAYRWEL